MNDVYSLCSNILRSLQCDKRADSMAWFWQGGKCSTPFAVSCDIRQKITTRDGDLKNSIPDETVEYGKE